MNNADQDPDSPLLITVKQAAERLGLSRSLTYQLVMSDAISSVKIGRSRRVIAHSLAAFVRELEVAA